MPKLFAVWFLSLQIVQAQIQVGVVDADRRLEQQIFERWALDAEGDKRALAQRQAVQTEEFYSKARQFVVLWREFAVELNGRKTFNAKLAKKVSKAFHDLEKSDGWPAGRTK